VHPSLEVWLDEFCNLHGQARRGELTSPDRERYVAARNELAGALLKAQRITLRPGEQARQHVRVAAMLPVTLRLGAGLVESITRDVGAGGFSVTLPSAPPPERLVPFTLRLARDEVLEGDARLVNFASDRASFSFDRLTAEALERIELTVFDAVVNQLWT
jgi:hypothetical protein